MIRNLAQITLFVFLTAACSDAEFIAPASQNKTKNNRPSGDATPGQNQRIETQADFGTGETPQILDSALQEGSGQATYSLEEKKRKCWFAVSGTFLGTEGYAGTFPTPKEGGEIDHGKTFDTVGGVYLHARAEPYEYGQGEREIDLAIDKTFDSIAIAPDMKAKILDGSGNVLFEGEGPVIAGSHYYLVTRGYPNAVYDTLKSREDLMPQWIKDYLVDNTTTEAIRLQAARSVLVSPIAGGKCDSE